MLRLVRLLSIGTVVVTSCTNEVPFSGDSAAAMQEALLHPVAECDTMPKAGSSLSSPQVSAQKYYLGRGISALMEVGFLSEADKDLAQSIENAAPEGCNNGTIGPRELASFEAMRGAAVTSAEAELISRLWSIMEIAQPQFSMQIPRVVASNVGKSALVPQPAPVELPIATLATHLQDVASRTQLFHDFDSDPTTVSGMDLLAAERSGSFSELTQLREISNAILKKQEAPALTVSLTQGDFSGASLEVATVYGAFRARNALSFDAYNSDSNHPTYGGYDTITIETPSGVQTIGIHRKTGYQRIFAEVTEARAWHPDYFTPHFEAGSWLFELWKDGVRQEVIEVNVPSYDQTPSKSPFHEIQNFMTVSVDGIPYGFDCKSGTAYVKYVEQCAVRSVLEFSNTRLTTSVTKPGFYVTADPSGTQYLVTVFPNALPAIQPLWATSGSSVRFKQQPGSYTIEAELGGSEVKLHAGQTMLQGTTWGVPMYAL